LKTLRARLIISHLLPILIIIPITGIVLSYVLESQFLLPRLTQDLTNDSRYLAEISRGEFQLFGNPILVSSLLDRVGIDPAIRVMFFDQTGKVLYSSDSSSDQLLDSLVFDRNIAKALSGDEVISTNYSIINLRNNLIDVFSPVISASGNVIGVVRVSYQSGPLFVFFTQLRNLVLSVLVIGLLLGALLGLLLALNIGSPIQRVTRTIYGIAQGERSKDLPEEGPEELRNLSRSVNYLVQRLDSLEQARRQLLANLVHELGRPLGGLNSAIHAILHGAGSDPKLLNDLAEGMEAESQRMQRVLEDLTHLHDQVVGTLELRRETINPAEWLPKIFLPWHQVAEEKKVVWRESIPDELPEIYVDPVRLDQVLGNLASNAIKYTPPGGQVDINVISEAGFLSIKFHDTGLGIPKNEQEKIFNPFYRGDQGRRIKQGMGLGLSIARDLAIAHDGSLTVESEAGKGSSFTVKIPLMSAETDLHDV
jgi:signal transduction histidine kinase